MNNIKKEMHTVAVIVQAELSTGAVDYLGAVLARMEQLEAMELITDENFIAADQTAKNLKKAEDALGMAIDLFLQGDEFAALDEAKTCREAMRSTRLHLARKVKEEKEARRTKLLQDALAEYVEGEKSIKYPSADHALGTRELEASIKGLRANIPAELSNHVRAALDKQQAYSDEQQSTLDGYHDQSVAAAAAKIMETTGVTADRALIACQPAPEPAPEPTPEPATVKDNLTVAPELPLGETPEPYTPRNEVIDEGLPFGEPKNYVIEISFNALEGEQASRCAREIKMLATDVLGEGNIRVVLRSV